MLAISRREGGEAGTIVPILQMRKRSLREMKVPSEYHSHEISETRQRLRCSASLFTTAETWPRALPTPPPHSDPSAPPRSQAGQPQFEAGPRHRLWPPDRARTHTDLGTPTWPAAAPLTREVERPCSEWARQTLGWLPAPCPSDPGPSRPRLEASTARLSASTIFLKMKGSPAFRYMKATRAGAGVQRAGERRERQLRQG